MSQPQPVPVLTLVDRTQGPPLPVDLLVNLGEHVVAFYWGEHLRRQPATRHHHGQHLQLDLHPWNDDVERRLLVVAHVEKVDLHRLFFFLLVIVIVAFIGLSDTQTLLFNVVHHQEYPLDQSLLVGHRYIVRRRLLDPGALDCILQVLSGCPFEFHHVLGDSEVAVEVEEQLADT